VEERAEGFSRSTHSGGDIDIRIAAALFSAAMMLLRRATIRDNRFKSMAIFRRDLDDNPCSHAESLNCFDRIENRPKESVGLGSFRPTTSGFLSTA
jgi:hypothetical protein